MPPKKKSNILSQQSQKESASKSSQTTSTSAVATLKATTTKTTSRTQQQQSTRSTQQQQNKKPAAVSSTQQQQRNSDAHLDVDVRNLLSCDTVSVGENINSMLRRRDVDPIVLELSSSSSSSSNTAAGSLMTLSDDAAAGVSSSSSNNSNKNKLPGAAKTTVTLKIKLSLKEALGVVESFDLLYKHIDTAFKECKKNEDNHNDDADEGQTNNDNNENEDQQHSLSPISASLFDQTIRSAVNCIQLLFEAVCSYDGIPMGNNNNQRLQTENIIHDNEEDDSADDNNGNSKNNNKSNKVTSAAAAATTRRDNPVVAAFATLLLQNNKAWLRKFDKIFVGLFVVSPYRNFFDDAARDLMAQIIEVIMSSLTREEKRVIGADVIESIFRVLRELDAQLQEEAVIILDQLDLAATTATSRDDLPRLMQQALIIKNQKPLPFLDSTVYTSLMAGIIQSVIASPENKKLVLSAKDVLARLFKYSYNPLFQLQIVEILFRTTRNDPSAKNIILQLDLPQRTARAIVDIPKDSPQFFDIIMSTVVHPFNKEIRSDTGRMLYFDLESVAAAGVTFLTAPSPPPSTTTTSKNGNKKQQQQQQQPQTSESDRPIIVFTPRNFLMFPHLFATPIVVEYCKVRSCKWGDAGTSLLFKLLTKPSTMSVEQMRCGPSATDGSDVITIRFTPSSLLRFREVKVIKNWLMNALNPTKVASMMDNNNNSNSNNKNFENNNQTNEDAAVVGRRRGRNNNNKNNNNNGSDKTHQSATSVTSSSKTKLNNNINQDAALESHHGDDHDDADGARDSDRVMMMMNDATTTSSVASPSSFNQNYNNKNNNQYKNQNTEQPTKGLGEKSVRFDSEVTDNGGDRNSITAMMMMNNTAGSVNFVSSQSALRAPQNSVAAINNNNNHFNFEGFQLPQLPPQTLLRPQDQQHMPNNSSSTTTTSNSTTSNIKNSAASLSQELQLHMHKQLGLSPTPFNPRNFMNPPNSSIKRQREQYFKDQEQKMMNEQQHQQQQQEQINHDNDDATSTHEPSVVLEDDAAPPVVASTAKKQSRPQQEKSVFGVSTNTNNKPVSLLEIAGLTSTVNDENENQKYVSNNNNNSNQDAAAPSPQPQKVFGFGVSFVDNQQQQNQDASDSLHQINNNNNGDVVASRGQSASRKLPQSMSPTPFAGSKPLNVIMNNNNNNNNKSNPTSRQNSRSLHNNDHNHNNNNNDVNNNNNNNNNNSSSSTSNSSSSSSDAFSEYATRLLQLIDNRIDVFKQDNSQLISDTVELLDNRFTENQAEVAAKNQLIAQQYTDDTQPLFDRYADIEKDFTDFMSHFKHVFGTVNSNYTETISAADQCASACTGFIQGLTKESQQRTSNAEMIVKKGISKIEKLIADRSAVKNTTQEAASAFDQIFRGMGIGNGFQQQQHQPVAVSW